MKKFLSNTKNKEKHLKILRRNSCLRTKETFKKCGETHSKNIKLGLAKTRKGQKSSIEHRKRIGEANKVSLKKFWENNPQAKLKMRELKKEYYDKNPKIKERNRELLKGYSLKNRAGNLKRLAENPSWREARLKSILRSLLKRPTSFEQKIILLCSKHRLPFTYTGDGRILIGCKNPDFVHKTKKTLIEVFLNYFKVKEYGSVENYIKQRGEHFAKYGYKTIFIREEDIKSKDWETICLHKIGGVKE